MMASNVPDIYMPFFSGGGRLTGAGGPFAAALTLLGRGRRLDDKTIRSRLPFESISLRRTPCEGTCPVYEMVLYRDGRAELNAQAHLPKLGKFVGEVHLHTYGRLSYLIESSHFSEMNSSYDAHCLDLPTCIVTVTSGATVKAVSDDEGAGPIQLWAIQELLDAVKDRTEWKPAK